MPAYDDTFFDPPAPFARVRLRSPDSGRSLSNVGMLIDTGADVTLIPDLAVSSLGLQFDVDTAYELTGFDGSRSVASAVNLDLVLSGRVFRGRYLGIDQEWGILGRDILNHLSLALDGPGLTWKLQSRRG